ncbi:MAG: flavodoxin domain-containing protein [Phascolarctobacterium sp.]|nr:flavodoxin domain-containing protein [Phascolarctobacterium sp.]
MKVPVIFWSSTGNTTMMAEAVADAINAAGGEAMLLEVGQTTAADAARYPALALGCPAMGVETLEEVEFEPFFAELEGSLKGKKVVLFGSYGWGGTYMQDWENRVRAVGVELLADGVLAMATPDDAASGQCAEIGKKIAGQICCYLLFN